MARSPEGEPSREKKYLKWAAGLGLIALGLIALF
ncbi:MAG: hypothetical protein UV73_C0003G0189 [Candidatus Gottesmanbacteria bacterium GW2011_GWA2_43_14]|uniref:Uncharacterized protein n=1 Tax=Candidatus Gottesmanbacteria bacterium GW2011_GWA2_43_14 TaxID=1618443 RepID=A0A0G1DL03_9BACT|nr:MAG: hypothetical protein UV73_C0003G0189 [Candidatus Gottesmanbacteria bacterium GW2011_GWA2_43_14]